MIVALYVVRPWCVQPSDSIACYSTCLLIQVRNGTDLDATVHFASNISSSAPNATLTQFLAAVLDGTFSAVSARVMI